jgi:hypothetical protein
MRQGKWIIFLLLGILVISLVVFLEKKGGGSNEIRLSVTFSANPVLANQSEHPIVLQSVGVWEDLNYAIEIVPIFANLENTLQLRVEYDGEEQLLPVIESGTISVGAERFTVKSVTEWTGIRTDAQGQPHLSILYIPDSTIESTEEIPLVLKSDESMEIDDIHLSFHWGEFSEAVSLIPPARWGINEGGNTSWFSDLTIGNGIELNDGTRIILLKAIASSSQIEIGVIKKESRTKYRVDANNLLEIGDATIYFENTVRKPRILICTSNGENVLQVHYFKDGDLVLIENVHDSEVVRLPPGEAVKVMSVLPKAVPIESSWAPWAQVVLEGETQQLIVRQGETVRVGDTQVGLVAFQANQIEELNLYADINGERFEDIVSLGEWKSIHTHDGTEVSFMIGMVNGALQPIMRK